MAGQSERWSEGSRDSTIQVCETGLPGDTSQSRGSFARGFPSQPAI